jgi:hypothetical protein
MGGTGTGTLVTTGGTPISGGPLSFETIYQTIMKAISDPNYARIDEIKAIINQIYLDEVLVCDELYPLYWLLECDEARKTVVKAAITGITAASPGVVTATAHGLSTGDVVMLEGISGMTELNKRMARVYKADANSFQLLNLDGSNLSTSAMTAYSSGGYAYFRGTTINNATRIVEAGLYGHNSPLTPITPAEIEADSSLTDTSVRRPTRYLHKQSFNVSDGTQYDYILLYGAADAAYNLRVWYEKLPARLVNTTDIPYLPHRFQDAIIAGAITRLGENKVQVEAGVIWPTIYQMHLDSMRTFNRKWWHTHENNNVAPRRSFLK